MTSETEAVTFLDAFALIEAAVRHELGEPAPAIVTVPVTPALVQTLSRILAMQIAEREPDPLGYISELRAIVTDGIRATLE